MERGHEESGDSWFAQTGSIAAGAASEVAAGLDAGHSAGGGEEAPRGSRDRFARLWRPVSLLLLLLGPVLAAVGYRMAEAYRASRLGDDVAHALADRSVALGDQVSALAEILHACRALYDASEVVERSEFAVFTRHAFGRHPAISYLAWAPRVRAEDRSRHEAAVRAEGLYGYAVRREALYGLPPASGSLPAHYPLTFLESRGPREDLLGIDLAAIPSAKAAIEGAVDSEEATLTDPFPLPGGRFAALLLLVVHDHRDAERVPPAPNRGRTPLGFLVAGLRYDDLLTAVQREVRDVRGEQMALELVGSVGGATRRLAPGGRAVEASGSSALVAERARSFGGQSWILRGHATDRFVEDRSGLRPALLGLGVFLAWELLVGCLVGLATSWRTHALRRQGKRVQSVLRSLAEGVVVVDPTGRVRLANAAAHRLIGPDLSSLGQGSLALEGRCFLADGVTACPRERFPLVRAIRGESVGAEEILLRSPDAPEAAEGRWLAVTAQPLRDAEGRPCGGVMVVRDVTARKRAETQVRRLSNAVEQTADAVFITDPEGRIEYVNPAFERVTGYPRGEVEGRSPRFLRAEPDADELCEALWGTVRQGEVFRGLIRNRRRDGTVYYAEHTITPVKDATGKFRHVVAVSRDMTESLKGRERDVEMRLAAQVQEQLYPRAAPQVPGLDLAGLVMPASATCGDYYDYLTLPDGSLGIAIGDVSGHGLGPALLMSETRALVRALVGAGVDISEALRQINVHLSADLAPGLFVTLILVVIDPGTRRLRYASAGHTPGYVLGADGAVRATLSCTGVPLGMFPRSTYHVLHVPPLAPGDVLLLMTDGAPESPSPDGGMLEEEGVLEVARRHRAGSATEILQEVRSGIERFSGSLSRRDDITLVVAKAKASPDPAATLAFPARSLTESSGRAATRRLRPGS